MKTIGELERKIRKLKSENDLLKVKLAVYTNEAWKPDTERGEFHHRAFERLCPMPPDMDNLTIKGI